MGLFSTSNITCNERPSVGRNFRDTINESASPINRFTEKAETRSFDEIFYEADIAIREASNSMNKLWYKSVLESDTVESAIINEANIFSKIVEVIKNIFEKVKKALSAVVKKVREFFTKIFKKKDKEGTENTKSDGKETRGTSKESTPTSSSEETTEKVTKAVDDVEKLEKEKKELEKELEKAKKEEENKKKEEDGKKKEEENKKKEDEKKAESDKDEPKKKVESDKNSDSIDTKNIDTSSLDKPKDKPEANNDMDSISISVPDTSKLESINKKIEEKNKAIENKKKEIESVSSDNDGYPKIEDFDGDYAKFKQAIIDYNNAKDKAVKDALDTAEKGVVKGTEDNNATAKAVEARLKELMGKYDEAAEVIKNNYKALNNAPKIFPYFDLFTANQKSLSSDRYDGDSIIKSLCLSLYRYFDKANPGSAVALAASCISSDIGVDFDLSRISLGNSIKIMMKDGKLDRTAFTKALQTKTSLDIADKNCVIAACFKEAKDNEFLIMPRGYVESAKNMNSKLSLEYFYKGASANDGLVGTPTEQVFSNFLHKDVDTFLNNIKHCKDVDVYGNKIGVLGAVDGTLKTLDAGEKYIIQCSYTLSNSVNKMKLEEVDKNFMNASVIPILQKTICNIASFCAQIITEVYSTRLKVCTEAYNAGNRIYDEILRLCVRNEVLNSNKK